MGRPRTYDSEQVLDAARDAFWRHGYEGTSVANLCRATGLEKGSLYHAFGDKKQLFLSVLDRYLAHGQQAFDAIFDTDETVPDAVRDWLLFGAGGCRIDGEDRGCMAVNSMVEMAPHDPEVAERLSRHFESNLTALTVVLERGQAAGQVRGDRQAAELAGFVVTVLRGIAAASRGGHTDQSSAIDLAVEALIG